MHHSEEDFNKVEVNALYHRLVWTKTGSKMQGQLVMREVCRKQLEEENFPQTIRPVNPPMVTRPLPWLGPKKGCYFYAQRGVRGLIWVVIYDMGTVQRSLDALNSVPWRVNRRVFDTMEEVWSRDLELAKVPPRENVSLKSLFKTEKELTEMSPQEIKLHLLHIQSVKRRNAQLISERPTFLLRLNAAREYYHIWRLLA
ncbi:unnamed protein product, partial [Amoebophrya sp. A25]|eukprot:GSA25T00000430001.1